MPYSWWNLPEGATPPRIRALTELQHCGVSLSGSSPSSRDAGQLTALQSSALFLIRNLTSSLRSQVFWLGAAYSRLSLGGEASWSSGCYCFLQQLLFRAAL